MTKNFIQINSMYQKYTIFTFLTIVIMGSSISNFYVFQSYLSQYNLISDAANGSSSLNVDEINKIPHTYPNLSLNSVPIATYKAMQLNKYEMTNEALEMIKKGIVYNPFLAYSHYQESRIYLSRNDILSATESANRGYILSPKIPSLAALYFTLLSEGDNLTKLISYYPNVEDSLNETIWRYYILALKKVIPNYIDNKFYNEVLSRSHKLFKIDLSLN